LAYRGFFYGPKEEKVSGRMGRPMSAKSQIEEISVEIASAALNALEDFQMEEEVKRKFQKIAHAANFITSLNNGLRLPTDASNAHLAEIMGNEVLA
jgi:hypothetical protein